MAQTADAPPEVSFGKGVPGLPAKEGLAFKAGPTVKVDGDNVRIEFEVNKATDVAVEILDKNGKAVRHLAAGLLGPHAPEPLAEDSLKQSLVWDRKDDDGKPVAGPCKVHVGLGLGVRYAGEHAARGLRSSASIPSVPWTGTNIQRVFAVTTGPDGEVYVLGGSIWSTQKVAYPHLIVLDSSGKFEREVFPPPADKLRLTPGAPVLRLEDGSLIPEQEGFYSMSPVIGGRSLVVDPDGKNLLVATTDRQLIRVGTDGSYPNDIRRLPPGAKSEWDKGNRAMGLAMAVSPDGRSLYVVGARAASPKSPGRAAIYRMPFSGKGEPELFWAPADKAEAAKLMDLATDDAGHVYAVDRAGNRIVKLSANGKIEGQFSVDRPEAIAVHPKHGTVYVVTTAKSTKVGGTFVPEKLVKLSPEGKVVASTKFREALLSALRAPKRDRLVKRQALAGIALIETGKEPVIWVGCNFSGFYDGTGRINGHVSAFARFADEGTGFRSLPILDMNSVVWDPGHPVGVNRRRRGKYRYRFVSAAGTYRVSNHTKEVFLKRMDATGKEVPFPGANGRVLLVDRQGGSRIHFFVDTVNTRGDVLIRYFKRNLFPTGNTSNAFRRKRPTDGIDLIHPDGTAVRDYVFGLPQSGSGARCVRCDRKGNVYTSAHFLPPGRALPREIKTALAARGHNQHIPSPGFKLSPYGYNYGSVIKISAKGGGIVWCEHRDVKDPAAPAGDLVRHPTLVWDGRDQNWRGKCKNVDWMFVGTSPYPICVGICICAGSAFDLDEDDRLFVPDAYRMCVHVLDSEGNTLLRFGHYGNMSDPVERLSFGRMHITFSRAGDGKMCVLDAQNSRVTILDEVYAAEKTMAVP